jgi:A/G-specific adenine glycosylase
MNLASPGIPREDLPRLRRQLQAWYAGARRDLDWRRTRDPYGIWLSEIMLQQTRVAAVVPYYRRFLARFPTVHHLAKARIDSVLRHWAGLGYYTRARHLHRAAKQIVAHHGGEFPRSPADALALPGIGSYTAAAVLSIAYDAPLAVLDGNVARVLARLDAVRRDLRLPRVWRRLKGMAETLLAASSPGDWNQAMMELGATVCTPRAPRCAECPVSRWCRARSLGIVEQVPVVRRRPATVRIVLAAAVLLDPHGRTLVVRHPELDEHPHKNDGAAILFSRLWQFPSLAQTVTEAELPSEPDLARQLRRHLARNVGITAVRLVPLEAAKHAVTFRDIRLLPFLARVQRLPDVAGARTPRLAEIGRLPISSATRKIAAAVTPALRNSAVAQHALSVSRSRPRTAKSAS